MAKRIYLASSWRNEYQQKLVKLLRDNGHEVYDFRNPRPGNHGFGWSQIDPNWKNWTPVEYREALRHPIAKAGYRADKDAIDWCDTGVLALPSGRSAHAEAGWIGGTGKPVIVYLPEQVEPELMYRFFIEQAELHNNWGFIEMKYEALCLTEEELLTSLES